MANKVTMTLEGLSDLADAISELPKATQPNVVKRALNAAADPIQQAAASMAPHLTGALQRSIIIGTKLSRAQAKTLTKESKIELFVGAGSLAQAITQEFGTVHNRPQPFMRPAWAANSRKALDIIKDQLATEIEKARQRLARKAARLLAKGG
jgi:HK97 gp10 family phage protein